MEQLIAVALFLVIGYAFGSKNEGRHYKKIRKREEQQKGRPAVTFKSPPPDDRAISEVSLVTGSTVVSTDYFKRFFAGLKLLVGGRLTTYESLLDRARREAILRMKESAPNADLFINVRIETSAIGQNSQGKNAIGSIEVLAFGTAISYQ